MTTQALLYFFHISGLALWLGGLVIFLLLLQHLQKQVDWQQRNELLQPLTRMVNWVLNPSAFIVLISGVILLINMGWAGSTKPFYMNYMERFGSMVILFSMIILFIQARGIQKFLQQKATTSERRLQAKTRNFALSMLGSTLLILSVVLVVSMKI